MLAVLRAAWWLAWWMFVLVFFLLMRPPYNLLWVAGTVAAVLWWHVLRPGARRNLRERATLRLRPLPRWAWPWLARGVGPLFVANLAAAMLGFALRLSPGNGADVKLNRQMALAGPVSLAALYLWMLAFAPLVEELVCRGWLQRPLERRLGPVPAIGVASAVFAALHMQPAGFANRFIIGVVAGYAVYVTGSIWAGVAMHASNNVLSTAIALLSASRRGAATATKPAWHPDAGTVVFVVVLLALSLHVLLRLGRGMAQAAKDERDARLAALSASADGRRGARQESTGRERSTETEGGGRMSDTMPETTAAPASLHALLEGIVDYAGLFPPAALPMADAVARYAEARAGADAWMLGRFVVPAARLDELAAAAAPYLTSVDEDAPWRVSALAGPELAADFAGIEAFNLEHAGRAVVDSVEIRAADPTALAAAARQVPIGMAAFFEFAPDGRLDEMVAAVKEAGAQAKVRTGGVTADAFPAPGDVLRFLAACARAGVSLKATAGLHHPLRAEHRLTYEPDPPRGVMFGFLNVFLAAAFLRAGLPEADVAPLLEEGDPAAFRFGPSGVEWRGHRLTTGQIREARGGFAASFGSCSFDEPADDLKALGFL